MKLEYFQVFLYVYETLSMSVAANKMFLTQPAISRIIREMESTYHCRFFLRHSGRLYRTESGEKMYLYAKQLITAAEQMEAAMLDQTFHRKVRIGATPTAGNYYLFDAISRYQQEGGHLEVLLSTHSPSTLEAMVKSGELDIAVADGINSTQDVRVRPMFDDELVFVAAEDLHIPEVLPLLVLDRGHTSRLSFEKLLLEADIQYQIKGHFSDVEGIRKCAALGMGVGVLPVAAVLRETKLKRITLPGLQFKMQYSLALHRHKFVFPDLNDLISRLEEYIKQAKLEASL